MEARKGSSSEGRAKEHESRRGHGRMHGREAVVAVQKQKRYPSDVDEKEALKERRGERPCGREGTKHTKSRKPEKRKKKSTTGSDGGLLKGEGASGRPLAGRCRYIRRVCFAALPRSEVLSVKENTTYNKEN